MLRDARPRSRRLAEQCWAPEMNLSLRERCHFTIRVRSSNARTVGSLETDTDLVGFVSEVTFIPSARLSGD